MDKWIKLKHIRNIWSELNDNERIMNENEEIHVFLRAASILQYSNPYQQQDCSMCINSLSWTIPKFSTFQTSNLHETRHYITNPWGKKSQ